GFNKAHAADYAKVTCQTAFLKAHYPVEYLTAMLSVERDNTDKVRRYFSEARNLGIAIAPPDINHSGLDFTIQDHNHQQAIRFGLGAIKNAGESALTVVLNERYANGPFNSLQDFCDRVDLRRVGKRTLEYMIKAHVFDSWGTVPQFLEAIDRIMGESGQTHQAAAVGQMSLFGSSSGFGGMRLQANLLKPADELREVDHKQLLEWEKEALGVHVSEHPLERPLALLKSRTNAVITEIDSLMNGKNVRIAGIVTALRTLTTKKGQAMAFGTLEDLDDKIDLVFFPRTWEEVRSMVKVDQIMLIMGKVQVKDDQLNIIVNKVVTQLEATQADERIDEHESDPYPPSDDFRNNPHTSQSQSVKNISQTRIAASDPAAVETQSFMPPPPPNFDDAWQTMDTRIQNGLVENPEEKAPSETTLTPSNFVAEETYTARSGEEILIPRNGKQGANQITVEIKAAGNWQETCRRTLKTAKKFPGQDQLTLRFPGQRLAITFPENIAEFCDELIDELERIPGIIRVFGD
ncbi:MAG: OB-fold nucleic acid binding domain-containing protein, partial [Candidatus Promineifilaceae bacterium]|nr:OB-fold nucleic acid binding domain-containing protein [Candidatus Promineifilaceae bacterium]